ncbi:hypothetical protein [Streptomyces sp. NPDC058755]|uniref:hypothetical protein n=1 Tax=Streptomyces sp. NPDC058755 TaxID=3346624 RepID=UPI00368BFCF7
MTLERPLRLLVRALGEPSPLHEAYEPYEDGWSEDIEAYTGEVPLDAPELGLPDDLADVLRTWCLSRAPEGFDSRPALRRHVAQSLAVARRLAGHLGPSWAVRYRDERHRTAKWDCSDDPAAALHLSDDLVAAFYRWMETIDATLNLDIQDQESGKYDAEWDRLFHEGTDLAGRLARELGPVRKVTHKGLANGGLAAMTSVSWRGDRAC